MHNKVSFMTNEKRESLMKKILSFLVAIILVIGIVPYGTARACEMEYKTNLDGETRGIIPIDFQCPYCGAIGYPTGQTTIVPFGDDSVSPMVIPIYMIYECSENSSHRWTVYLAETTT